jgi:hypothetical protein
VTGWTNIPLGEHPPSASRSRLTSTGRTTTKPCSVRLQSYSWLAVLSAVPRLQPNAPRHPRPHAFASTSNERAPASLASQEQQRRKEIIMRTIASALLALSVLAGVASPVIAANDTDTTNLQDLERQNRAGNPGG